MFLSLEISIEKIDYKRRKAVRIRGHRDLIRD